MTPEFWLERWQRGETGWHQSEINRHLREFWPQLGLPSGLQVLVPLCGKTLDLLWLAGQGQRVLGVEISQIAVEEFFAEAGLDPVVTSAGALRRYQSDELTLLCGDVFALAPGHLREVGAIYDRGALVALPPALRRRYVEHLETQVPATVPRLLITFDYDQQQMVGPPFAVPDDEVERLFADRYRITRLASFDVIDDSPEFRRRGLIAIAEQIWRLDAKA